jgi:hypothetical protein
MQDSPHNRRKHERHPAQGSVRFFSDGLAEDISGEMLDISESGFRASHNYPALSGGEVVRFQHASREGRAKVVWTRIVSGRAESGFLFVPA